MKTVEGECYIYRILTIYPNSLCMMFPTVCRIVQYCPAVYSIVQSRQFHSFNCEAKLHRQLGIFMDLGFNNGSYQKNVLFGSIDLNVGVWGQVNPNIYVFMAYLTLFLSKISGLKIWVKTLWRHRSILKSKVKQWVFWPPRPHI